MSQYLGLPPAEFEDIRSLVSKESLLRCEIPRITLPLPENHALVSVASHADFNALAVIWKQVLFAWQNPKADGWSMTKLAFDRFYVKQGRPELISSLGSLIPSWLHETRDMSTYVKITGESHIFDYLDLHLQALAVGLFHFRFQLPPFSDLVKPFFQPVMALALK